MDCPICQYKGLDDDAAFCPSCKTDLTAFQAMNSIEASYKKQRTTSLIFIILFILALLACVIIYLFIPPAGTSSEDQEKLSRYETSINEINAENEQLKGRITDLESEIQRLAAEKEAKKEESVTHEILAGETLYLIAKKYLGEGKLYRKIAADNNIEDPDLIVPGQKIIIQK